MAVLGHRAATIRWTIVIGLIVILEAATRADMIDRTLMVPPTEIVSRLTEIVPTAQFGADIKRTAITIATAFIIGLAGGVPIGVALWKFPAAGRVLEPFIVTGYAMPTLLFYGPCVIPVGR